jgi:hypothetical protein
MNNFGTIKSTYNILLAEGIAKKTSDGRAAFKNYIRTVKESKSLKTQFDVYYFIENKVESDKFKASEYVNECISLLDSFSKKEIKEANLKLTESKEFNSINLKLDDAKVKLYEDINTLIFTKKSPVNIDKIVDAKSRIVDYILNNKKEEVNEWNGLPNSIISEIAVDKFNEKYSDLDESEMKAVSIIMGVNESEKEEFYKSSINECLSLINGKLTESSGDIKEKLLATKENLLNRNYNKETFVSDVSKIIELKNNLNQN